MKMAKNLQIYASMNRIFRKKKIFNRDLEILTRSSEVTRGHDESVVALRGRNFSFSGNSFDIPIKNCSLCEESISNKNCEKPVFNIGFGKKTA